MPKHLLEDHTGVEGDLFVLVASESSEDDIWSPSDVIDGWPSRTDLTS
jgi:hypothetical protein